ncbi:MAG: flagellar filament capping protein FliD [Calditrichaeota bacterium]|nr:flagellar filament capping protein FliD [Calditrichota bacterium]
MPGTFSVGGLASGLDTQNILDQLVAIERRPITLLQNRKDGYKKKLDVWNQVSSKLSDLISSLGKLRTESNFKAFTTNSENEDIVTLSATSSAEAAEHSIKVLQIAQQRKISSQSFESKTENLGLTGDFLIDGKLISVSTTDSLMDIRDKINNANAGVQASILELADNEFRLVIASKSTGEDGFHILDASTTNILQNLGLTTGTESIKNQITGGVESDSFSDISATIGSVLNLSSPQSGTVTIGDKTVSIDLSSDTLSTIKDKINAASPTGVVASIVSDTENNQTIYKLRIEGTSTFSDDNNILQTLGILEGDTGAPATAQVITGSAVNTTDGSTAITAATTFGSIYNANVSNGDTITIVGKDHSGTDVSSTFTITDTSTTTVQDLLDAIESAFSGAVTASVNSSGKIVVTDNSTGTSQLDVNLIENNEGGGSLNFGTFSTTTTGRDAISGDLQAGQDASIEVDGIQLTRSSNSISDILQGVTLNLHKADTTSTVNISVSRDFDTIKSNINDFIKKYNGIIDFINKQFTYDTDKEKAGTLLGDTTLISVQSEIKNIVSDRISGLPETLRSLAQIGIDTDSDGKLSMDESKFDEKIQDNFDGVVKIFSAIGETTDSDISYINHTKDTLPGTYAVNITQAATQAEVLGTTNLQTGIAGSEVLTLADKYTGQTASITLDSGLTIDEIVSKINAETSQTYSQKRTSSGTILTSGNPATSSTLWSDVDGDITSGDTITISGTTHNGNSVSSVYTVSDGDTVGDFLTAIQDAFDNTVTATINDQGEIVVTDVDSGTSQMDISLTPNNEGGGSLDLGTMDLTQTGRYDLEITAYNDNGYLKIVHDSYGSAYGFSVTQSTNYLGITDGSYAGQDVAGTINGENATGTGQILTGDSGDSNIDGLSIQVTLTPSQLSDQGADQGSISLTYGVAEQLYTHLKKITDEFDGYVSLREKNIQDTMDDIQDRIDLMEQRVAKKKQNLEDQFLNLERSMAALNSLQSYLGPQLAHLSSSFG